MSTIIKTIRNCKKINDFNKMETSFADLTKAFEKAKPVIAKVTDLKSLIRIID